MKLSCVKNSFKISFSCKEKIPMHVDFMFMHENIIFMHENEDSAPKISGMIFFVPAYNSHA